MFYDFIPVKEIWGGRGGGGSGSGVGWIHFHDIVYGFSQLSEQGCKSRIKLAPQIVCC